MKKVFICSPYRGGNNIEQNIVNAKRYCQLALQKGCLPIAPHLYFPQFLNDQIESERDLGIQCGLQLLQICDELWYFTDGKNNPNPSEGMIREIEYAKAINVTCCHIRGV